MKMLAIISCILSVFYTSLFVALEYDGRFNGFWHGGILIFIGLMFCLFPLFQGIFGFSIKNMQSKKTIRWLRVLLSLTLAHVVFMIVLSSFLTFPLLGVPLDIGWILVIREVIKKKRVTVKKIFDDFPVEPVRKREIAEPGVNDVDTEGLTPLMRAVLRDDIADVRYLLKQPGLRVNLKHAASGNTALCLAALNGLDESVHLLIMHPSTRIGLQNNEGLCAFDLARANGHYALAEELRI